MYSRLNPDSSIDFGTRRHYACVREWMRMNRCSQNKLAGRIGVSGPYLSRILRGERYMTLDIGRKLSAETGIPLRQIFIFRSTQMKTVRPLKSSWLIRIPS